MSYDDWKTTPPPMESAEDGPGCVICGIAVKPGERYCGPSCEQEDSGDYPWDSVLDYAPWENRPGFSKGEEEQ